jgi:Na+/melibiose symporter-like transporter
MGLMTWLRQRRPRWVIAQSPLYGFAMGGLYLFIGLGTLALSFVGASPRHTFWRIMGVLWLAVACLYLIAALVSWRRLRSGAARTTEKPGSAPSAGQGPG